MRIGLDSRSVTNPSPQQSADHQHHTDLDGQQPGQCDALLVERGQRDDRGGDDGGQRRVGAEHQDA